MASSSGCGATTSTRANDPGSRLIGRRGVSRRASEKPSVQMNSAAEPARRFPAGLSARAAALDHVKIASEHVAELRHLTLQRHRLHVEASPAEEKAGGAER